MATITSDTTTMTTIISDTIINSTTIMVMTCSVVFIVNIKKIKSLGGMLEETTDGGIELNEAYGIVGRREEGEGERGGDTASVSMRILTEYEEITIYY